MQVPSVIEEGKVTVGVVVVKAFNKYSAYSDDHSASPTKATEVVQEEEDEKNDDQENHDHKLPAFKELK